MVPHKVRISSGAPVDALSLRCIYAKPSSHSRPPYIFYLNFDCLVLDSLFVPPLLAEFPKIQNDIAVNLQLHPDAFASAMVDCFIHHSPTRRRLTDFMLLLPHCLCERHTRGQGPLEKYTL
jgi:hypothetical protein